jgi:LysR family transcriptional activator of nhaA
MADINYKHLRYFWMVGKTGSIARASELLFITPQSISGQLTELEVNFGAVLLRKVGRGLEMTEIGRQVFSYADEIFSIGNDLAAFIASKERRQRSTFRLGISDCIYRSIACDVIEPILGTESSVHLICKTGKLTNLLADLSVHRMDVVIADRPMPENVNIRAYNHHLGSSKVAIFGAESLIQKQGHQAFPQILHHANFLMPGEDYSIKNKLIQWFESNKIKPHELAEFDDSALLKLFAKRGEGFIAAPYAFAEEICSQYHVKLLGIVDSVVEHLYAITTERRISHPAMISILESTNMVYSNNAQGQGVS